jgi:hypothetical protein
MRLTQRKMWLHSNKNSNKQYDCMVYTAIIYSKSLLNIRYECHTFVILVDE